MNKALALTLAALLLLGLAAVSAAVGTVRVPLGELGTALTDSASPSYFIVHEVRLPRIVVGILAGFGLATGGVILQSLVRNPLASPDVIGISKGAGLAAAATLLLFPKMPGWVLPPMALAGALAAFLLLMLLSRRLTLSPATLALVGVALGAVFQAGTQYLLVTHPTNVNVALLWLAGSLWGRGWREAHALLPWIALLLPLAWASFARLNVLQLGDESGLSLGLRLGRERFRLLLLAVALAGASVAAVGAIGFIGLLAPHIARSLVGSRHQWLIPLAALLGADLMLLGDCLGRIVIIPREIPVGIMSAVIGAPYFVYLLRKESSRSR